MLARIASRLVARRAWERLGFARLSDYAAECLGISGRSVRSLAEVGARLERSAPLEAALTSGALGWTKVRLLARLPEGLDEEAWIAWARGETAETLSRAVRDVDRGSIEGGAVADDKAQSRLFEVRCTPEVRWKWGGVRTAASRAAGRVLHISEAAELVAAEVLSALPIDEQAEHEACFDTGASLADVVSSRRTDEERGVPIAMPRDRPAAASRGGAGASGAGPTYPPSLVPLLLGLEQADAFELDERMRRAVTMEQRLDARIGPLLAVVWRRFLHRALGFETRESYARARLGMDPTRARALVRLERLAEGNEAFASAYRTGDLSWVGADALSPLVEADPLARFTGDWVAWAARVTVRRLRMDVENALTLREVEPSVFQRTGGLPPEARARVDGPAGPLDREIGATVMPVGSREAALDPPDREIGATAMGAETHRPPDICLNRHPEVPRRTPTEVCWARFIGPPDVVQLFRAVLNTVRRRMERESGRLPTAGEALGVMLDHVDACWGFPSKKVAAQYKVFARDGWRCAAPGCTSMQNLHSHHIHFRSAQGVDDPENRITLCAFHHLRGVHAGLMRCVGRSPDGLRWEMGIRPGVTPRMAYRSGDIRIRAQARAGGVSVPPGHRPVSAAPVSSASL